MASQCNQKPAITIELFYSLVSERLHQACVGGHCVWSAGLLVSGHATFFSLREDLAGAASEDDEVVVHADEEGVALVGVGMRGDSKEVILTFISWDLRDSEGAGVAIAGTALDAVGVENVAIIASEVDAAANHAHKEGLAVILTTHNAEEFFSAVDFLLRTRGGEGEGNQS